MTVSIGSIRCPLLIGRDDALDLIDRRLDDAIAIGIITNVDTRSHSYRVYIRFLDPSRLLIGEDYWDTPPLDPGQSYRYEVRHMALNGITQFTCNLSEVLIRN